MGALTRLMSLAPAERAAALSRCCGASRWAQAMSERLEGESAPQDDEGLLALADEVWAQMGPDDYLEAFTHHPQIGASPEALRARFAATSTWSAGEQAGVQVASEEVIERLAEGNAAYLKRFGYIFIVCATGKSAAEMLALLEERLPHEPEAELLIAAAEQAKITKIRLNKLAEEERTP